MIRKPSVTRNSHGLGSGVQKNMVDHNSRVPLFQHKNRITRLGGSYSSAVFSCMNEIGPGRRKLEEQQQMHNAASFEGARERARHESIHEISAIPSASSSCCVGGHEGENGKRRRRKDGKKAIYPSEK